MALQLSLADFIDPFTKATYGGEFIPTLLCEAAFRLDQLVLIGAEVDIERSQSRIDNISSDRRWCTSMV